MNEFEVYRQYVALKQHFSQEDYDFFLYNGKTRCTVDSYNKRRDRFFFKKLAKQRDPIGLIVSNFVYSDKWVGDIVDDTDSQKIYNQWITVNQSLSYVIKEQLKVIGDLKTAIESDNHLPKLFQLYFRNEVYIETVVVLMDVLRCYTYWNKTLKDDPLARQVLLKLKKYKPFVKYDKRKMRQIIKEHASEYK